MTQELKITLLDVGWGDSIFLQWKNDQGEHRFGLIDSNDTKYLQPSRIFLRRYFRRHLHYVSPGFEKPYFDFVLLSHDHADHRAGLENIMKEFGTQDFFYPHTERTAGLGKLLDFAERERDKDNGCVRHHEALDSDKPFPDFGDVAVNVLWPPPDHDYEHASPNDTSVVLSLHVGKWYALLTGDAETEVWDAIASDIHWRTRFVKVPHHGSVNGTFGPGDSTTWFSECPQAARLGISCDLYGNFVFPRPEVIRLFDENDKKYFRTDRHYHVTFVTDGDKYDVEYSH
jgi:beta-lactamase superfamily II metal-dependent hydrolase